MSNILKILDNLIKNREKELQNWFNNQYEEHIPLFYNSVDIRFSGNKICPIDTNIFPAGFNNLSDNEILVAQNQVNNYLKDQYPNTKNILLITESHTRNQKYQDNIIILYHFFKILGYEIHMGHIDEGIDNDIKFLNHENEEYVIYKCKNHEDKIIIKENITPDLIIVNNDFSSGSPKILKNIQQPIIPPTGFGWYKRTKMNHFNAYNYVAKKFALEFDFPAELITTEIGLCKKINFKERKGLECIAIGIEKTLTRIKENYKKLNIPQKPYVFIKANRGTYGMGIMTANHPDDIYEINKKTRNKMNIIKQSAVNTEVIIQEGIETQQKIDNNPSEETVYLINTNPIGTLLRYNDKKDNKANLNSTGMQFSQNKNYLDKDYKEILFLIAKLATLASHMEDKFYE